MLNPLDYYISPEEYELASKIEITPFTLERRIRLLGWSKQRAMTTPVRKQKPRGYYRKKNEIAK